MFGNHITKDGTVIPITLMDDNHLWNTIKLGVKLSITFTENQLLASQMLGIDIKLDERFNSKKFNGFLEHKFLYILEAMRRDTLRSKVEQFLLTIAPENMVKVHQVVEESSREDAKAIINNYLNQEKLLNFENNVDVDNYQTIEEFYDDEDYYPE